MFSRMLESSGRVRRRLSMEEKSGYVSAAGEPRKYFAVI
jgi:hypothetical protein